LHDLRTAHLWRLERPRPDADVHARDYPERPNHLPGLHGLPGATAARQWVPRESGRVLRGVSRDRCRSREAVVRLVRAAAESIENQAGLRPRPPAPPRSSPAPAPRAAAGAARGGLRLGLAPQLQQAALFSRQRFESAPAFKGEIGSPIRRLLSTSCTSP